MRHLVALFLASASLVPSAHAATGDQVDAFTAALPMVPKDAAAVSARCDEGMALLEAGKARLEAQTGPASLEKDLVAHDRLLQLVRAVYGENDVIGATNKDKAIRDAAIACSTRAAAFDTDLFLSPAIYARLSAIPMQSIPEDLRYGFEDQLNSMRLSGVTLAPEARATIAALEKEIAGLGADFGRNIAENQGKIRFSPAALVGLPADWLEAHPADDDGLVVVTTAAPDIQPVIQFADLRGTRRAAVRAMLDVAWPENKPVLEALIDKRAERAKLLGFDSHAAASMSDRMIGSPERAWDFLEQMGALSKDIATRELAELTEFARTIDPTIDTLEWSDIPYFTDKLDRQRHRVDAAELRQYFTTDATRQGIFDLMTSLFGATFAPWATPVWDESVTTWEMRDEDGSTLGRFYLDLYPREGKFNHAAQFSIRQGMRDGDLPVAALITNFSKAGQMDHGEAVTFLHEFGHLVQKMYSDHQPYAMQSRSALPGDFGEAPSTFLEEWAFDYPTLATFARNAEGETIPEALVERANLARRFGRAQSMRTGLALSAASLALYETPPPVDVVAVFRKAMTDYLMVPLGEGAFLGMWGHLYGYSSNYYTYDWSKAIALDLQTRFTAAGMHDKATAHAYRDEVLRSGGKRSPDAMIEAFLGRPLNFEAVKDYLAPAPASATLSTGN
ncbi:M3 family metallopeptidase [Sphingomicrobium nitratireducens]|uniref:M3 family metallopeptidase n=1 Tax=Sphingomicrobium nitratireducens TaxID=2964666 RepID=UPI00223EDD16|nr:M3 family metallopeptidase [Sphingomicrobium nitratireducens]